MTPMLWVAFGIGGFFAITAVAGLLFLCGCVWVEIFGTVREFLRSRR
jgi:hypothetical protein